MIAWDAYAGGRPHRRPVDAAGERTWFNWTQYPDHGPGVEVLSVRPGARVLDLGCGKGGNLAHIATIGCQAVGVDVSGKQIEHARQRWNGLELYEADALAFLEEGEDTFEAIYSVFGAVWFVDPDRMLPAVYRRLRGILAFSYVAGAAWAVATCDLAPHDWVRRLQRHGFVDVETWEVKPPAGMAEGTVLVRGLGRGVSG